jgi:hemerythrin superfamily protein
MFGTAFNTDAIGLLKDDHRMVEDLLDRFEACENDAEKLALAQEICQLLTVHAHVEEALFYPALRKAGMAHELLDEAAVEHATVKHLIEEIDGARADAAMFDARVKVLGEYVMHHVAEEENEIMPEARSLAIDLDALGEDILAMKTRLESKLAELADDPGLHGRVWVPQIDGRGVRHP